MRAASRVPTPAVNASVAATPLELPAVIQITKKGVSGSKAEDKPDFVQQVQKKPEKHWR